MIISAQVALKAEACVRPKKKKPGRGAKIFLYIEQFQRRTSRNLLGGLRLAFSAQCSEPRRWQGGGMARCPFFAAGL